MNRFIVLFHCLDQPGIVHQLTGVLIQFGANIIHADQHSTNSNQGQFFMRIEFVMTPENVESLQQSLDTLAHELSASIELFDMSQRLRCCILVSKEDHCLQTLLLEWSSKHLSIDIDCIISNHNQHQDLATWHNIPFQYVNYDSKSSAERQLLSVTQSCDVIIMARFMQILSDQFLVEFNRPVINIHHSFLPSFKGAKPYQQAFDRGVKLIGATAHFATADLDEGPIISQHVSRVTHRHEVDDLKLLGRQLEQKSLLEAVRLVAEHRVIVDQQKTIVFN